MKTKQVYDLTSPTTIKRIIKKLANAAFQSLTSVNQDGEDCILYLDEEGYLNREVHQKNGHIRIDQYDSNGYRIDEIYNGRWDDIPSDTPETTTPMSIAELQKIMTKYGLVIRAIPKTRTIIYDAYHINKYPNGKLKFLEEYNREMCVVTEELSLGGKFIIQQAKHQFNSIQFTHSDANTFDSIEEAVTSFLANSKEE